MYLPFCLRIIITSVFFLYFKKLNCLQLFLGIWLLDTIDCDVLRLISSDLVDCKTHEYKKYDKIADIATYIIALILYGKNFDKQLLTLLWSLVGYRLIGVIQFFRTNDNKILHTYIDGINSTLLISCFTSDYIFIGLGLIFKFYFERYHHNTKYIKPKS